MFFSNDRGLTSFVHPDLLRLVPGTRSQTQTIKFRPREAALSSQSRATEIPQGWTNLIISNRIATSSKTRPIGSLLQEVS